MATKQDLIDAVEHYLDKTTPDPDPVPAQLDRIKTLTQTARTTWFGYLGALAFAGITVLGVEDIDFFSVESATQLPFVNISVPVTSFFAAGSFLIVIVYGYLHVFLEQIWYDLSRLPKQRSGDPIAFSVQPWLITEAALRLKSYRHAEKPPDVSINASALGNLGVLVSGILGWAAGPVVVGYFWWRSMPAHDAVLTGWTGTMFTVSLFICWKSFASLWRVMKP